MKTSELDYNLPSDLIAQEPIEPRDASKLLVLDRKSGLFEHRRFSQIDCYLKPDDLLVVNDTKVLPARLKGVKQDTGAKIEVLLLVRKGPEIATPPSGARNDNALGDTLGGAKDVPIRSGARNNVISERWEVLTKPAKRLKTGDRINFGSGLKADVIEELENGRRLLEFKSEEPFLNVLQTVGEVPLPPYIVKPLLHPNRYQTVYARKEQSAAAPTAGLHFTSQLLKKLKAGGIKFAHLTLAIGMDTFQPIREEDVEKHQIHSEYFEIGQEAADLINEARRSKNRIIAVGTTSARVLETIAPLQSKIKPVTEFTNLFIYPGYQFKVVDSMVTNFHLPRSTLLAMVTAFAGLDNIKKAYAQAIKKRYRFFSFGDAMMIL